MLGNQTLPYISFELEKCYEFIWINTYISFLYTKHSHKIDITSHSKIWYSCKHLFSPFGFWAFVRRFTHLSRIWSSSCHTCCDSLILGPSFSVALFDKQWAQRTLFSPWFWRRRFLNFVYVFSLFYKYQPLGNGESLVEIGKVDL